MKTPGPDAPDAEWLVYADALQQRGDPIGEFIALVHSAAPAKRAAWFEQHGASLIGDLAASVGKTLTLEWRWSFIEQATITATDADTIAALVTALLAHPLAERLHTLRICAGPADQLIDLSATVTALGNHVLPPRLELIDERANRSTLLTSRDFEPRPNLVEFGELTPLWRTARALKLVVGDVRQLALGVIDAPSLESLTIHGLRLATSYNEESDVCAMLSNATLPRLRHFDMRLNEAWTVNYVSDSSAYHSHGFAEDEFDSSGYVDEFDSATPDDVNWDTEFGNALRSLVKSPLERLSLTNFASTSAVLELIATTGLPPSLRELDLSQSSLSTRDLAWFTSHAPLLTNLRKLTVLETGFSDDDVKTLRTIVPEVEFSRAKPRLRPFDNEEEDHEMEEEPPLPKYRYTVGME